MMGNLLTFGGQFVGQNTEMYFSDFKKTFT
eukprot:UN19154